MADGGLRLFVAVPLPPEAVADCAALIDGVRSGPLGKVPRWVHVPNLHLTIRFLGATPDAQLDAVAAAVDAALAGIDAFDVELAGAGAFPDAHKPRTLWLGIRRGADELGAMARALDGALAPLGWPPEGRPYRPHLTVARLDAAPRADGVAIAQALDQAAAGWHTAFRAREAVLFRSHLGGGAPRHEPLLAHALAGA